MNGIVFVKNEEANWLMTKDAFGANSHPKIEDDNTISGYFVIKAWYDYVYYSEYAKLF